MSLTDKQQRFVEEYLIDLNGTQAALRAGYSPRTANEQAAQLLAKLSIQEAVQEAQAKRSQRVQIDQDWVLKRLAAIADCDIRNLVSWDEGGTTFTPSKDLEWKDAYTVTEVILKETIKQDEGGSELVLNREKKLKQADKKGALDSIAKHLGMDKLTLQGDKDKPIEHNHNIGQATTEQLWEIIRGS